MYLSMHGERNSRICEAEAKALQAGSFVIRSSSEDEFALAWKCERA